MDKHSYQLNEKSELTTAWESKGNEADALDMSKDEERFGRRFLKDLIVVFHYTEPVWREQLSSDNSCIDSSKYLFLETSHEARERSSE